MKLSHLIARFVLLVVCPNCAAEMKAHVDQFEEFLARVTLQHPLLDATQQEIEGARADFLGAQGAFDPVLKGEYSGYPKGDYSGTYANVFIEQPLEWYGAKAVAGYRKGGGNFPIYEDYYVTNSGGEVRAGLEVPVLRDGPIDRRRASIARASLQISGVQFSLTQRQVELMRAAAFSYWDWVAANQKQETYQELLATAQRRDRQLAERVKRGDLARIDKVDNERQVLQRQAQLVASQRALQKATFDLSLFLWSADGTPELASPLTPPSTVKVPPTPLLTPENGAVETALALRVEHRRLDNQLEQQKVEHTLAENQLLPRFDLQALTSNDLGSNLPSRDEAELKAGVKLEIPLATRSQRGRLTAIAAKKKELVKQRVLAEQKISVEVRDSYNAFLLAVKRAHIATSEVKISLELEAGERTKFEQGESNLIFVNLREQGTADAEIRAIDAIADCWKSYAGYYAALGKSSIR